MLSLRSVARHRLHSTLVATLAAAALLAACGGGGDAGSPTEPPPPTPPTPTTSGNMHPGFDMGVYPGDAAVRAWARPASPYEWMGYYLPAPCHRDSSFVGKRSVVTGAGLGVAVLYVGQQTWDGVALKGDTAVTTLTASRLTLSRAVMSRTLALRAMASAVTCSRTLLSTAQGTAEGDDAIARAAANGFPNGTVIYLDLEPMTITTAMRDYYRAWVARLSADGRYRPGIYAHYSNATAIHDDVGAVPFWIARTSGFGLTRPPTDAGFAFATAWQGALDVSRTWGGVTLRVDESVSDRASPSGS